MDDLPDTRPLGGADAAEQRVALIELLGAEGQVLRTLDVPRWPCSLGRALDNTLVLDDPHTAAHHARLALDGQDQLRLVVLDTVNGAHWQAASGAPEQALAAGGDGALPSGPLLLRLGRTRLRLRRPDDPLPAERPLRVAVPTSSRPLALVALALAAWVAGDQALSLDPGAEVTAWLPGVLGIAGAICGWCLAWGLLSKLFQHRFDFFGHLRLLLPALLALSLLDALPLLAASADLPTLGFLRSPLQALLGLLLVHAQFRLVFPGHERAVTGAVVAFGLVAGVVSQMQTWQAHDRWHAAPYLGTLPPAGLRLSGTQPADRLLADVEPLARRAAERAQARRDTAGSGED